MDHGILILTVYCGLILVVLFTAMWRGVGRELDEGKAND